jgi:hypothetical protein
VSDETRRRFFAAIAAQLPVERIREVHLFPSMRQSGIESGVAVVAVEHTPPPDDRCIVVTARYRLTLKGPDRGKWETSVTEEADAPLHTLDAVVRGVSRRSGDADESVRLSGYEFRATLPEPARP